MKRLQPFVMINMLVHKLYYNFLLVQINANSASSKAINYDIGGMENQPQIIVNNSLFNPSMLHIALFTVPVLPQDGTFYLVVVYVLY